MSVPGSPLRGEALRRVRAFVAPGPCEAITASMESTTSSDAVRSRSSSSRVLRARRRSSGKCASTNVTPGSSRAMSSAASAGRNARSTSDALHFGAKLSQMIDDDAARNRGVAPAVWKAGVQNLPELLLVELHPVPDIGRLIRAAFDVDQKRQIAADADRVEMIEEEEPVAAEEILDVVLRARSPPRPCPPRRGDASRRALSNGSGAASAVADDRCGRAFIHRFLPRADLARSKVAAAQ